MEYLQHAYTWLLNGGGAESCYCAPPKVICFGNVLLDRTVRLTDTELLQQFHLELDTKGELDIETLSKIISNVCSSLECRINPGGSALNTARILQQLGTRTLFFGAIGQDKEAEQLKELLEEQSLKTRLQSIADTPTGQCICLTYNDSNALYANIGASSKFSIDFLKLAERGHGADNQSTFLRPVERKQVLYLEGFFVTDRRQQVIEYIVQTYVRERRRLALNLSASYIVDENYETMLYLVHNSFIIFGNRQEYEMLCKHMNCSSFEDMARELVTGGAAAVKIIVITKGGDGVQLISNYVDEYAEAGELTFQSFNAPRVLEVVDSTGAGDAFAAGFMHAFLQKRSLSECVRVATDVAAKVVTQIGCSLP